MLRQGWEQRFNVKQHTLFCCVSAYCGTAAASVLRPLFPLFASCPLLSPCLISVPLAPCLFPVPCPLVCSRPLVSWFDSRPPSPCFFPVPCPLVCSPVPYPLVPRPLSPRLFPPSYVPLFNSRPCARFCGALFFLFLPFVAVFVSPATGWSANGHVRSE